MKEDNLKWISLDDKKYNIETDLPTKESVEKLDKIPSGFNYKYIEGRLFQTCYRINCNIDNFLKLRQDFTEYGIIKICQLPIKAEDYGKNIYDGRADLEFAL
jgi:hypothetical protein